MNAMVGYDCGDHGDDTPPDSRGEPRPSFDHDVYVEWGLCGGRLLSAECAELSGMSLV
jgi:hypothetical protein